MAAIIELNTGSTISRAPLHSASPDRVGVTLTLIPGGRSVEGRRMRRIYFFRRCVAAAAVLLVVAAVAFLGRAAIVGVGSADAGASGDIATYVVRQGDTLWGVAQSVDPTSDPRDVIDQIAKVNAADQSGFDVNLPLTPGQELIVPVAS